MDLGSVVYSDQEGRDMYCPQCGKQIADDSVYCRYCGKPVNGTAPQTAPPQQIIPQQLSRPPAFGAPQIQVQDTPSVARRTAESAARIFTALLIGAGVVTVVIIGLIVVGMYSVSKSDGDGTTTEAPTIERWLTSERKITPESFVVQPQQYVTYTVPVTSGWRKAVISGHFQASGGNGNDIKVLVLDEESLINWRNNHSYRVYYESGKVTAGTLNVGPLAPNTYYLVFSNTFSLFSNKAVRQDISLKYEFLR